MISEKEFSDMVQKHRMNVRATVDLELIMGRLRALKDSPAEMLLWSRT